MAMGSVTWLENIGVWLGTQTDSEFDLAQLAEDGLPIGIVRVMTDRGLTTKEVYSIVIPERTLKHRKSRKERLSREESDKAIRTARLLARAQSIFGNQEKVLLWMRQAKQRFGGRTPLDLLSTEAGGRLVEEMLIQIDEGMFA